MVMTRSQVVESSAVGIGGVSLRRKGLWAGVLTVALTVSACGQSGSNTVVGGPSGRDDSSSQFISLAMSDSEAEHARQVVDVGTVPIEAPQTAVLSSAVLATTAVPVTVAPLAAAPVTVAPVTATPTTAAPVTVAPTTVAPTTVTPTTAAPVTVAPTTVAPTTVAPTTVAPTTVAPTTVPTLTVVLEPVDTAGAPDELTSVVADDPATGTQTTPATNAVVPVTAVPEVDELVAPVAAVPEVPARTTTVPNGVAEADTSELAEPGDAEPASP